jgi:hypothetical protein
MLHAFVEEDVSPLGRVPYRGLQDQPLGFPKVFQGSEVIPFVTEQVGQGIVSYGQVAQAFPVEGLVSFKGMVQGFFCDVNGLVIISPLIGQEPQPVEYQRKCITLREGEKARRYPGSERSIAPLPGRAAVGSRLAMASITPE